MIHQQERNIRIFSTASMEPQSPTLSMQTIDSLTSVDVDTYASLLKECGSSLLDCRRIHGHIIKHGHASNMFLGFLILEMYGKCGSLHDAMAWFSEMPRRDVCTWNYMIGLHYRLGKGSVSLTCFDQMLQECVLVDKVTYITIISVCTTLPSSLVEGRRMNARVIGARYESHVVIATALVNLYGKCGDFTLASELFDGMSKRDTITWNALISGFKQHKHGREVLQLFHQMNMESILASRATFACIFSNPGSLRNGKRMHVHATASELESEFVISNALVRMYSQWGSLSDAQRLFDALSHSNVVASNAMISAYAHHGCLKEALKLLERMQFGGVSIDMVTYMSMLDVCGSRSALSEGRQIHACIKQSGYEGEVIVGNALVTMYGKCQSLPDALKVFDEMLEKDVISWNAMISVYAQIGGGCRMALSLFNRMTQAGMIPNNVTYVCVLESIANKEDLITAHSFYSHILLSGGFSSDVMVATTLINMHGRTGSLEDTYDIFDLIPEPNVISWTAMISAHSLHRHDQKALQLFAQMLLQGSIPDMVTYLNVIVSCTNLMVLNEGKFVHIRLNECEFATELPVANALMNMYGKCGELAIGWYLFSRMPIRNLASWNVMIATCAQHGLRADSQCLLKQMDEVEIMPDKVTFVTYLSACSHIGSVEEAIYSLSYTNVDEVGMIPTLEHYDCIVDMFGRVGQLYEAESVISIMPFQPSALSWMTLLTTCRNLPDAEGGQSSLNHIVEVDPCDHVPYVMMANIYAGIGRNEDAATILASMMMDKEDIFSEENSTFYEHYNDEKEDSIAGLLCHG